MEGYTFDRCGITALEALFRGWHSLCSEGWADNEEDIASLWMTELVLFVGCALHDAQSSFRWALPTRFTDTELLKRIWVCIASIRQSWDSVNRFLTAWIGDVVSFVVPMGVEERAAWEATWTTLKLGDELVGLLVQWEVRYVGGRLLVSEARRSEANVVYDLHTIVLGVWRYRKYSDSRWLGLGAASCRLVAGQLLGISSFSSLPMISKACRRIT